MNELTIKTRNNLTYDIMINGTKIKCNKLKLNMDVDSIPELEVIIPVTNIEIDKIITDVRTLQEITYPQLLIEIAKGNFKQGGIVNTVDECGNSNRYIYSKYNLLELIDDDNNIIEQDDTNYNTLYYIDLENTKTQANMIVKVERWSANE